MTKDKETVVERRKTPRLLALEASKKAKKKAGQQISNVGPQSLGTSSGPPPSTQPKKKRLDELGDATLFTSNQEEETKPKHEAPSALKPVSPNAHQMPDNGILKFILDTLQRKDTDEFFAQPVDGEEVEGYYSFITEPMDFGTMRAKLEEGMYTTLKQFEDDVYLIFKNAMSFNSASTIYYRRARTINELANRVFSTLKNNPESIIEEFSETRRGSRNRKLKDETASLRVRHDASKLKRESLTHCGSSGSGGSKNVNSEAGRRQTYKPLTSIEEPTYSCPSKQLVLGDGHSIGYKESLLQFVKDLGPTAEKVAKQKLSFLNQTSIYSLRDSSPLSSYPEARKHADCEEDGSGHFSNVLTDYKGKGKGKLVVGADSGQLNLNFPPYGNSASECTSEKTNSSFKFMDLLQEAMKGNSTYNSENARQQSGSFLPGVQVNEQSRERMVGLFQPAEMASNSPQGMADLFSSGNSCKKSSVYPSVVVQGSGSSHSRMLMHPSYNYAPMQQQLIDAALWQEQRRAFAQTMQREQPEDRNRYGRSPLQGLNVHGPNIFVQPEPLQVPMVPCTHSMLPEANLLGPQNAYLQQGSHFGFPQAQQTQFNNISSHRSQMFGTENFAERLPPLQLQQQCSTRQHPDLDLQLQLLTQKFQRRQD